MRVVGGKYRGRKLDTPKNDDIRPTSDKVRQAMFNILNSRGLVVDATVIDAFCGTGALGIEALSQGANHAVFFDKNRISSSLTRDNVKSIGLESHSDVFCQDVTTCDVRSENIKLSDLVFLDPPYHQDLIPKAVENLYEKNWLAKETFFLMEMARGEDMIFPMIEIIYEKNYGNTKVLLGQSR